MVQRGAEMEKAASTSVAAFSPLLVFYEGDLSAFTSNHFAFAPSWHLLLIASP